MRKSLSAFNSKAKALGDKPITNTCVWQATAWELRMKNKRTYQGARQGRELSPREEVFEDRQ